MYPQGRKNNAERHARLASFVLYLFPNIMRCSLSHFIRKKGLSNKYCNNKRNPPVLTHTELLLIKELPKVENFTIQLCYKLISFEELLPTPSNGWGKFPYDKALAVEDDIERIRHTINEIIAINNDECTENYLVKFLYKLERIIQRFQIALGNKSLYEIYNSLLIKNVNAAVVLKEFRNVVVIDSDVHQIKLQDRERYSKISAVITDFFPKILRIMISSCVPPTTLYLLCRDLRYTWNKSENLQIETIQSHQNYESLNSSMLYRLLRLFSLVGPPTKGWGREPYHVDLNTADDIERIHRMQNELANRCDTRIDQTEFDNYFVQFREITQRIAAKYEHELRAIAEDSIDPKRQNELEVTPQKSEDIKEQFKSPIKMENELQIKDVRQRIETVEDIQDKNIQLPWLVDDREFQRMLSLGEYLSYENRLSLGGPCRAGKSTLASVLIGEQIPLQWNSTDGLVIYFGRNGIDIENKKMIPLPEDERGHEVLAKILRGKPYVGKGSDQITRQETQTSVRRVRTEVHTDLKYKSTTNFKQDDNETTKYSTDQFATKTYVSMTKSDMEHLSTHMSTKGMPSATSDIQTLDCQKLQLQSDILGEVRNGQYRIKIAPSDIIDFGGQKSFDTTHQLFIQQRGSFVLMFDGRHGLHDELDEYPEGVTAACILKHWVDSILTYTEDTKDIMPMILFAATHRDKCKGDIEERRLCFIRDIKHMLSHHEKRHHLHMDTVYFINGTDKNDLEIQHMTDRVVLFAMQQSSWGQRRPMQWVPLELQISNMRMKNVNIITMEDIHNINKLNDDLALSEIQLIDFLLVQHSLGKLMYYNRHGLDKCIIIHPPALVNILRSFVTDKKFFPTNNNLKSILQTLTQTGKIYRTDLLKLWEQDHIRQYMQDESIKEFVIQLLVHLDILIVPKALEKSSTDEYLVPSMIKNLQPDFKNLQHHNERTICLEYSLTQNSFPSALAYKVIGAAIITWPLKEEDNKPNKLCLYHMAAVLNVSEDDELRIWFEDNRVMVYLTNKRSLLDISPDVAASVQELLTKNIESSLLSYFNSFGKKITPTKVVELYTLALGVPCGTDVCFRSVEEVKQASSWTCDRNKKHNTKYLMYWMFDRSQMMCALGCEGLSDDELGTEPSDKHLVRLGSQIRIKLFHEFYIHLGMTTRQWENTSYMYGGHSCEGIMSMALVEWKKSKLSYSGDPTLKDIADALGKVNLDNHVICQVFREETKLSGIADFDLLKIPSDEVLKNLSYQVGNCALQLGIELGVSFNEVENSLYKFPKDLPGLIEDILKKWKANSNIKTFQRLMLALQCVRGGGMRYLHNMLKKHQ